MKDETTLKGRVSGATFALYQEHERRQLEAGKPHAEILDNVVASGLEALSSSRSAVPSRKKK